MKRTFRARVFHRNLRVLLVVISLGICIIPAMIAWNRIPEHHIALGIVFSLPGLLLTYLSTRWLMSYYIEYLTVQDDRIIYHNTSRHIEIPLADVTKVR